MAESSEKVLEAKGALMMALGDNFQRYLDHLKLWFRYQWSKDEFDMESRRLLTPDQMHLHNQFLIAILNKVEAFNVPQKSMPSNAPSGSGTQSRKRKRSSKCVVERAIFEPYDLHDYLPEENVDIICPPNYTEDSTSPPIPEQRYCVQELFLPDAGFIMGRLLVGAWENGLVNVDDEAAEYIATAVKILLKNIISAVVMKRKHYRVTGEGTYYYDIGCPIKDPFVRNTVTRQIVDDTPIEIDKEITSINYVKRNDEDSVFLSACEELAPPKRNVIGLRDLYRVLQHDRNIIKSHSIHSITMERITQMLH